MSRIQQKMKFLKRVKLEFSFSETGCLTKAKESKQPNYLPKASIHAGWVMLS